MTKRIVLKFPSQVVDKPFIYHLVKDYGLMVNVLKANVNPHKEGFMVMELSGANYDQGVEFLINQGVKIEQLADGVIRNTERCIHCGHCTSLCPSNALYIVRPSMEVMFDEQQCVVCGLCLKACPFKAIELNLNGNGKN